VVRQCVKVVSKKELGRGVNREASSQVFKVDRLIRF
jgi:hypothetical protein